MEKIIMLGTFILMTSVFAGCIATQKRGTPFSITTDTEHVLFSLMEARCKALSSADLEALEALYTKDSTEPEWLEESTFPFVREWPAAYRVSSVENITVVGRDAAATYNIVYYNDYKSDRQKVDVLYELENGGWKIYSVNSR